MHIGCRRKETDPTFIVAPTKIRVIFLGVIFLALAQTADCAEARGSQRMRRGLSAGASILASRTSSLQPTKFSSAVHLPLSFGYCSASRRINSPSPAAIWGRAKTPRFLSSTGEEGELDNFDSDVNGAQPKQQKRKAATGWNHNLPNESSNFWVGTRESKGAEDTSSTANSEPRTGWLHNTKPKKKAEEEATTGTGKPKETEARRRLRLEKEKRMRNHRILGPPTFHPCGDGRRIAVMEHKIAVPLSRSGSGDESEEMILPGVGDYGATIDVFFTTVELVQNDEDETFFAQTLALRDSTKSGIFLQNERADLYVRHSNLTDADGMILYLQGGPGFGAPAPVCGVGLGEKSSWAAEALSKGFKRVVLMDQRGTGRSTPITKQTLQKRFPDLFALDDIASVTDIDEDYSQSTGAGMSIAEQLDRWEAMNPDLAAKVGVGVGQAAEYMSNFRADNIVKDAEDVKTALLLPQEDVGEKIPRPWGGALGQSFGGFCMMTYLSHISYPPKICLLTGGIAPMLTPIYEVYERLWDRVKERNLRYYDTYPGDIPVVKRIVRRLLQQPATLPSGGKLTARRFLQLGLALGGSPSAFSSLHSLLASAFLDDTDDDFSRAFLKRIESEQPFDDHPIYFLMHESIYADGAQSSPTEWAAHRAYKARTPSDFRYDLTASSDQTPTLFFGEMVFPWMADRDYVELSGFGMRALAQSLATKDDWGPLYDSESMKRALAPGGGSKAAAAVYYDDMYVDFDCCMKVASRGGPLENCKVWITNDYQHSGLRDDGSSIFAKILGMAKGSIGTPS